MGRRFPNARPWKPIGQGVGRYGAARSAPARRGFDPAEEDQGPKVRQWGREQVALGGLGNPGRNGVPPIHGKKPIPVVEVPSASTVGIIIAAWRSVSRRSA